MSPAAFFKAMLRSGVGAEGFLCGLHDGIGA